MQFEDPTDTLQSLRDLIDLQRAMDCAWLQSAAEQVCCHLQHFTCILVPCDVGCIAMPPHFPTDHI